MISFSLKCENNHQFEGWFRSSVDYEDQVKKRANILPKL